MQDIIRKYFESIRTRGQELRYVASGLLSFCVENLAFDFLYYVINVSYHYSNLLSVLLAMTVNFVVSKKFVFRDTKSSMLHQQLTKYILTVAFNLCMGTIIIGVSIHFGVAAYLAKFFTALLIATWTYFIYKNYIFTNNTHNK